MKYQKPAVWALFILSALSLLAPLLTSKDLLFPFVTTKAFYFRILLELALPFYVYLIITNPKLRPNLKNPLNISVLAFLVANILSAIFGVNFYRSFWGNFERMGGVYYLAHLVLLYFYAVLLGQAGGKYLKYFLVSLIGVGVAVSINGIFGKLGWPTLVADPSLPYRVSSTLGNPIYVGSFLIIPIFLCLFFAAQEDSRIKKYLYILAALIQLIAVFLSGTRGAVVGLILGVSASAVLYLFITKNKFIKKYGFVALGVFVLTIGFLYYKQDSLPKGSDIQRVFKLRDNNTSARLVQWKSALQGYKDYPVFGTGPENYYVIANSYYNPELYKYDPSWFDKPHNYTLEILVTNGIVGFVPFMAMLVFSIWAFVKAYKKGFYGELELCLLIAGMLVYQIQNLFVFDTVPASLAFYSLLGFSGFLFVMSSEEALGAERGTGKKKVVLNNSSFGLAAAGVTAVVAIYAVVVTNFTPMAAAKNINYGYAYGSVDTKTSMSYFEKAAQSSFNFDLGELATKSADVANRAVQSPQEKDKQAAKDSLDSAIGYLEKATEQQPNYPVYWLSLSGAYLTRGVVVEQKIDPRAEIALQKEIELAPKRIEGRMFEARIKMGKGDFTGAISVLQELSDDYPTSKDVKVLLAQVYRNSGNVKDAVVIMEKTLNDGYQFQSFYDINWLADYYRSVNRLGDAIKLYEKDTQLEPNNILPYVELAKLYALSGDKTRALDLAQRISKADPSYQNQMNDVIKFVSQPLVASTTK